MEALRMPLVVFGIISMGVGGLGVLLIFLAAGWELATAGTATPKGEMLKESLTRFGVMALLTSLVLMQGCLLGIRLFN